MIIYRTLFSYREKLSAYSAIAYSTLLCHALWDSGLAFDGNGEFDKEAVEEIIIECKNYISLPYFTQATLARTLNITERGARKILKELRGHKLIIKDSIYCSKFIIEKGYLTLEQVDLSGWELVFYTLLKNRAAMYGGAIDTWARKLGALFGVSKEYVYMLISRLKKKGYVYRDSKGLLHIR